MDANTVIAGLVILFLVTVDGKRYCTKDDDCADLGELVCIKSMCDTGICSCPRSKVARWLGSEALFKCVPLKKVGESCSTDGDSGVCGAEGSECKDGTCRCTTSLVSIWGGEYCAYGSQSTGYGESCSASIGLCNVNSGGSRVCEKGTGTPFYWHDELVAYNYPTCSCSDTQTLEIKNHYDSFSYIGRKYPSCRNKIIGDFCLADSDCSAVFGDPECKDNQCACQSGTFPDYDGKRCYNGTALTVVGAACQGAGHTAGAYCDGSKGLMCRAELCRVHRPTPVDLKCVCGPGHITSGSNCIKRTIGSQCFGDVNCRSINTNAICEEGTCQNDGANFAVSMVILTAHALLSLYFN